MPNQVFSSLNWVFHGLGLHEAGRLTCDQPEATSAIESPFRGPVP
jgi:hypothetical protein